MSATLPVCPSRRRMVAFWLTTLKTCLGRPGTHEPNTIHLDPRSCICHLFNNIVWSAYNLKPGAKFFYLNLNPIIDQEH